MISLKCVTLVSSWKVHRRISVRSKYVCSFAAVFDNRYTLNWKFVYSRYSLTIDSSSSTSHPYFLDLISALSQLISSRPCLVCLNSRVRDPPSIQSPSTFSCYVLTRFSPQDKAIKRTLRLTDMCTWFCWDRDRVLSCCRHSERWAGSYTTQRTSIQATLGKILSWRDWLVASQFQIQLHHFIIY